MKEGGRGRQEEGERRRGGGKEERRLVGCYWLDYIVRETFTL